MSRACFLAVLVLSFAAENFAGDLAGRYYLQNLREVGSELLLKPDGTFEFALAYGAADYWAKGTWIAKDGRVILNSPEPDDENPPFKLIRSYDSRSAAIRIRVIAPGGRGVPNIDVALITEKEKLEARTDSDGIALFPKKNAPFSVAFRIRVYQLETELYELNHSHDDYTFEINGPAIAELRFKDERLTIKGNMLIWFYWGPDQEMHYVK
jgi:hypothetical protein